MNLGDDARRLGTVEPMTLLYVDQRVVGVIEASGTETHFTKGFDPEPRVGCPWARPYDFPL